MVELLLAMERIGVRFPLAAPKENVSSASGEMGLFLLMAVSGTHPLELNDTPTFYVGVSRSKEKIFTLCGGFFFWRLSEERQRRVEGSAAMQRTSVNSRCFLI